MNNSSHESTPTKKNPLLYDMYKEGVISTMVTRCKQRVRSCIDSGEKKVAEHIGLASRFFAKKYWEVIKITSKTLLKIPNTIRNRHLP